MVTEDYVSFETAKLLKEKGFDCPCKAWYYEYTLQFGGEKYTSIEFDNYNRFDEDYKFICYAPTLQMAMKWLREVHKLYVEVVPRPFDFEHYDIQDGWGCEVTHLSDLSYDGNYEFFQKKYSTYEEACEAAIKYCLENLI